METLTIVLVITVLGLVILNIFIINKIKNSNSGTLGRAPVALTKVVEQQAGKIDQLQKEVETFKRKTTGVTIKWDKAREDKAAYRMIVYNDLPERVFNVSVEIDEAYREVMTLYCDNSTCDAQKHINAFFLPGAWAVKTDEAPIARQRFCEIWLKNKLEPIKFIVKYTKSPTLERGYERLELYFATDNLTKHFRSSLQASKLHLSVVPKTASKTPVKFTPSKTNSPPIK